MLKRETNKRALRDEWSRDGAGDSLRSLLANKGLSHKTLQRVLSMVKEHPELASSTKRGACQAAYHGIFQSVRCMETLAQQDLGCRD